MLGMCNCVLEMRTCRGVPSTFARSSPAARTSHLPQASPLQAPLLTGSYPVVALAFSVVDTPTKGRFCSSNNSLLYPPLHPPFCLRRQHHHTTKAPHHHSTKAPHHYSAKAPLLHSNTSLASTLPGKHSQVAHHETPMASSTHRDHNTLSQRFLLLHQ